MDLLNKTKFLLKKYNIKPKKELGQNFCIDVDLLNRIVNYANLKSDDIVLEIGAGLGFLTGFLSKMAKKVIAVEIDPKLVKVLRDQLIECKNVTMIEDNILKTPLPYYNKIVANLPYSISSPFITNILKKYTEFERSVLALQEEFVNRLQAAVASKDYGYLTVLSYYKFNIQFLERVLKTSYYPQPEVKSNIVLIRPKQPPFQVIDENFFFNLVRTLFTQRNKRLKNALENIVSKKIGIKKRAVRLLIKAFPHLRLRVNELKPEEFGEISDLTYRIIERKKTFFEDKEFYVCPGVYIPSDDPFMLIAWTQKEKDERLFERVRLCEKAS